MCGIFGVVARDSSFLDDALIRAADVQKHRGPDSTGHIIEQIGGWCVGLGHQRLSILDLSDAGVQPMHSTHGESTIVYNGEVYNYREIISDIDNFKVQSGTDTEVVLGAIESFGVKRALPMFNGMWALAWLDKEAGKLCLARDRVGVKPLYYTLIDGNLYFASEVKTILDATGRKFEINENVVGRYIAQSLQDVSNETFFKGIYSLPAGSYAEIDLHSTEIVIQPVTFWDVFSGDGELSFDEAVQKSKELFSDAVKLRMRSDVPVGVTLSGGIDSSAIAAMMKATLSEGQELKILSAVSPGSAHDESEFIDIMADALGVSAQKVQLGWEPHEAIDLMRTVTWHNDSPLGSFSNVAHYLMMEKAQELGITVILSGQGADEILCGYKKYLGFYIQCLIREGKFIKAAKVLLSFIKNGSVVNQFNFGEAKRYLPSFLRSEKVDIKGSALKGYERVAVGLKNGQALQSRQGEDLMHFSVPYLTHYEDRMSMAWSREIRLPFLDYRLMELFVNLPSSFKLRDGWTKYVFREAMKADLPDEIVWRKDKQGFVNPQEDWLKNELRPQLLELFNEEALIFKYKLIDRQSLLDAYEIFCSQKTGKGQVWYRDIFQPLALEIWLQEFKDHIKPYA